MKVVWHKLGVEEVDKIFPDAMVRKNNKNTPLLSEEMLMYVEYFLCVFSTILTS